MHVEVVAQQAAVLAESERVPVVAELLKGGVWDVPMSENSKVTGLPVASDCCG